VGDFMLMGEFHHNIDEKNRLILPAKFREELGESFILTRGLEECLFVYPMKEWEKITQKLKNLPFTKKDARSFMRFFLSGATAAEFDKQGRINITSPLISYAEIKKECVIIGVGDRLEIWSSEKWNSFYNDNKDNLSNIAEDLFDSNWTEGE
jgi:MraZ protein